MNEHIKMVNAVANVCNMSKEEAWQEILHARQNYEENIAYDSERSYMYLQEALQDLGLESEYTEEFLTEIPYKTVETDEEDTSESDEETLDWLDKTLNGENND